MQAIMEAMSEITTNHIIETIPYETEQNFSRERVITFGLEDKEYGINIVNVREIIYARTITTVIQPSMQLKVSGKNIPVCDLRSIFGIPKIEYDNKTCIIIVTTSDHKLAGLVVDTVSDVMNLIVNNADTGAELPEMINPDFVSGVSKVRNKFMILIDVDRVLKEKV